MLLRFPNVKQHSVLPAFHVTTGLTLTYLAFIVLIPLSLLFVTASSSPSTFYDILTQSRVLYAFAISFGTSFIAGIINAIAGLIMAWVFVRYSFPFKKLFDALIDLPFALPTAVAGIAFSTLYATNGLLGKPLDAFGVKVAYTPLGIIMVLVFVGLPFVVRTLEPVLKDMDKSIEEASSTLGATPVQTFFRITLPCLMPTLLTGFMMAWARGLGEYGAVIFIAGNMPYFSEIVPLLIVMKLEQYDYASASVLACLMLTVSFALFWGVNKVHHWSTTKEGQS